MAGDIRQAVAPRVRWWWWHELPALAVVVWTASGSVALAQAAPGAVRGGPILGAMVGVSVSGDRNLEAAAPDFAVNADVPVGGVRIRAELGRAAWTVDPAAGSSTAAIRERLSITRGTVSVLKTLDRVHAYIGGGVGLYRYHPEVSTVERPTRVGLHLAGGLETPPLWGALGLRFEGGIRAIGGPSAGDSSALQPLDPGPRPPRVVDGSTVYILSAGAGITWRF